MEYDVPNTAFDSIEPTNKYDEKKKFLHKVNYIPKLATDYGQLFRKESRYENYEELMQTVYFAKDEAFVSEQEIRSLLYDSSGELYVSKQFDFLKRIVFGYRCSDDTKYVLDCLNKHVYGSRLELFAVSSAFKEEQYIGS